MIVVFILKPYRSNSGVIAYNSSFVGLKRKATKMLKAENQNKKRISKDINFIEVTVEPGRSLPQF